MRVLIIEDDPVLADALSRSLRQARYVVEWASQGQRADEMLLAEQYDLVILDLSLPKVDGLEVLRRLRQRGNLVPVLILTARDKVEDRVQGLDLGADDYLTKPYDLPELEARIRALLRRGQTVAHPQLQVGSLSLDISGHCATLDGAPLELSARELSVLELLMVRAGRVVSKEQISEQLSGLGEEMSSNAIEVYVHRLRKKIEAGNVNIRTMRGLGYLMERVNVD
jgi:two-component system OmpR family response regulator